MMKIRHLAVFFLLFFAATTAFTQKRQDFNRDSDYDVQHYVLRVSFERKNKTVIGDTTVILRSADKSIDKVTLDAESLKFTSVTDEKDQPLKYVTGKGNVTVELGRSINNDETASIRFKYTATPKQGIYFVDAAKPKANLQHSAQIWTQGEAEEARHWFPSFDFPSDKATTEQFITANADETVIGNGKLINKETNTDGTITWHYKMDQPFSTYLVSFIVGKYVYKEEMHGDIPLGYYLYPGAEDLLKNAYGNTKDMFPIFEDITAIKYPFNKYDQAMVANFQFGGMENITATTMADTELIYSRIPLLRGNVEDLVSHELAHSWFGNLVTCNNWAELYLNEAFATYMEAVYRERKYGREQYMVKIESDALQYMAYEMAGKLQHGLFNQNAKNISELFDAPAITYNKGGAVLHTLREEIGDEAFWSGVKLYLSEHKYANVETEDLKKAMEKTSDRDLDWFFDQWIYGTGMPKIVITKKYNAAKKELALTVTQTQKASSTTPSAFRFPLELEITDGKVTKLHKLDIDKRTETFKIPVSSVTVSINADPKMKVLPLKVDIK